MPTPAVQHQAADAGQLARLQAQARERQRPAAPAGAPGHIGEAQRAEQVLIGQLEQGLPAAAFEDLAQQGGGAAAVGPLRSRLVQQGQVEQMAVAIEGDGLAGLAVG